MKAKVKQDCKLKIVTAFAGHEYIKTEWRRVPSYAHDEAQRHSMLDIDTDDEEIANELGELPEDELRQLAKESGVSNYWNKKVETLIEELS